MRKRFWLQCGGKGTLAFLVFFAVINADAQEVSNDTGDIDYTSEEYLKEAKDNIRIGVNPFSGESLQLYELRRRIERKKLEAQLVAPTDEEIYQKTESIVSELLQESRAEARLQRDSFAAIIEDINVRIHALRLPWLVCVMHRRHPRPTPRFSGVSSLVEGDFTVKQAPPSAAYLDFGLGPRLLYRNDEQNLQSLAVDEYAPSAENAVGQGIITEINKNGATLENGKKLCFPMHGRYCPPLPLPPVGLHHPKRRYVVFSVRAAFFLGIALGVCFCRFSYNRSRAGNNQFPYNQLP